MATQSHNGNLSAAHAPALTRRVALTLAAGTVAATTATAFAATKALGAPAGACVPDPVFALIEEFKARHAEHGDSLEFDDYQRDEFGDMHPVPEVIARQRAAYEAAAAAEDALAETPPTTLAGAAALLRWVVEYQEPEGYGMDLYEDLTGRDWVRTFHLTLADALDKMAVAS